MEIERGQVLDFNEKLLALTTDNEPLEVLTQMQNYLGAVLKSPDLNRVQKYKFIKQIKTIEAAKKQLGVNMNLQTVLENLSFNLVL